MDDGAPQWERDGADWPHRERSRFVDAAGLHWHVQQWPAHEGVAAPAPTVLLLHGTGAATHSWRGLAPLLTEHAEVIAIDLPDTIEMAIVETAPGVRGNSATGRTKPATLATGHVVQVPEHLEAGTLVRVDTRTGEYLGRA